MAGHLLNMTYNENGKWNVWELDHYTDRSSLGIHFWDLHWKMAYLKFEKFWYSNVRPWETVQIWGDCPCCVGHTAWRAWRTLSSRPKGRNLEVRPRRVPLTSSNHIICYVRLYDISLLARLREKKLSNALQCTHLGPKHLGINVQHNYLYLCCSVSMSFDVHVDTNVKWISCSKEGTH